MSDFLLSETNFALNQLRQQDLFESLVFSPLSISLGLSLIHSATNGQTRDQIRQALLEGSTADQFEEHFSNLSKELPGIKNGREVRVANHVYCKKDFTIKKSYLDSIKKLYNAEASSLDFGDQIESAEVVNEFVREATKVQIKQIVTPETIQNDLDTILVSALYFQAVWREKFDPKLTKMSRFYDNLGSGREAYFLNKTAFRNYSENDTFQVIRIPYLDKAYSMDIFLPKSMLGLKQAVLNLNAGTVQQLLTDSKNTYLEIHIPKWEIESSFGLNEALQKIGIKDVFDKTKADFSNLANGIGALSKVAHTAMIQVDENGTTAAAAMFCLRGGEDPPEPIKFNANHPFMFMITKDNHPVFIGLHN